MIELVTKKGSKILVNPDRVDVINATNGFVFIGKTHIELDENSVAKLIEEIKKS